MKRENMSVTWTNQNIGITVMPRVEGGVVLGTNYAFTARGDEVGRRAMHALGTMLIEESERWFAEAVAEGEVIEHEREA